jgi:hypothetical protein
MVQMILAVVMLAVAALAQFGRDRPEPSDNVPALSPLGEKVDRRRRFLQPGRAG